jgi:23S rRNA A2030 N6-methylase RlmJ
MLRKILRRLDTEASRAFWASAEKSAAEIASWPAWRRAGINVEPVRESAGEYQVTVTLTLAEAKLLASQAQSATNFPVPHQAVEKLLSAIQAAESRSCVK